MINSSTNSSELLVIVLEIGIVIIFSLIVSKQMGKKGIPQVLGLIIAGVILQFTTIAIGFPSPPNEDLISIITTVALGFIGYIIGVHLDLNQLKNQSWRLILVLLGESIGAFILVTIVIYSFYQDLAIAFIFGSIAMATAPASTVEVIGEFKAEGPLSQTIFFIIAFDDILAIILFNVALSYSMVLYDPSIMLNPLNVLTTVGTEVVGSVILGILLALIIKPIHIDSKSASDSSEIVFPMLIICIAIAGLMHFSVILTTIAFGFALSNFVPYTCPTSGDKCILGVERLGAPIVALFFILVGYEMDFQLLFTPVIIVVGLYFLARATGKILGAYYSAKIANMPKQVINNLPFSLLTQAGVAVGLAALAFNRLTSLGIQYVTDYAFIILDVITISVLIAEIIGPLLVKFAIKRAGEVNMANNTNSQ